MITYEDYMEGQRTAMKIIVIAAIAVSALATGCTSLAGDNSIGHRELVQTQNMDRSTIFERSEEYWGDGDTTPAQVPASSEDARVGYMAEFGRALFSACAEKNEFTIQHEGYPYRFACINIPQGVELDMKKYMKYKDQESPYDFETGN